MAHSIMGKEPVNTEICWQSEKVYFNSRDFFSSLEKDLRAAKTSVDVEMYIFEDGEVASKIQILLEELAGRGVRVRMLVDGIGSLAWVDKHLMSEGRSGNWLVRAFHPLPWPFGKYFTQSPMHLGQTLRVLSRVNSRDHRKLFNIDDRIVYVGSMNVHDEALLWRETGVRVEGPYIDQIRSAFEWSWQRGFYPGRSWLRFKEGVKVPFCKMVLFNHQRKLRKAKTRYLLEKIRSAKTRVILTTPYFVPIPRLVSSLCDVASSGVEVEMLVPKKLYPSFMRWVAWLYFKPLLESNVKIYEYLGPMLHAKSFVVDDWGLVGSTNLNHRSIFRDLEIDLVVRQLNSVTELVEQHEKDKEDSHPVTLQSLREMPLWAWLLANVASLWKGWL